MSTYDELYNNICRLCLFHSKSENMVPLINDTKNLSHYGKAVLTFANISIRPDDNLPLKMCHRCLFILKQAIYFKLNCESSDKQLKTLMNFGNVSLESLKEKVVQFAMYRLYFPTGTVNNLPEFKSNNEIPHETHQRDDCIQKKELKLRSKNIGSNNRTRQKFKSTNFNKISESKHCTDNEITTNNESEACNNHYDEIPQSKSEKVPNMQNIDVLLDTLEKMMGKSSDMMTEDNKSSFNITSSRKKKILKRRKFLKYLRRIETQSERVKKKRVYKIRSLTCKVCRKVLANQHTYEHHMQRHNGFRFICELCGKGFPVGAELKIHQVARHGTGPCLQCQHCSFKAPRKIDLIEHERIHTGERPYTCDKCGLTFRRRAIWKKHLIYHMEKKVQCTQCPRKFYQRSEMLAHTNNVHDRVYVYLCNKCGVTYAKPATVRRHLTERHGIPREMQGKVIRVNKGSGHEVNIK